MASTNTRGHHPYRKSTDAKQAHHQDEQDDLHPTLALITRQVRKQQFTSISYNVFSHSFRVVQLFYTLLAHQLRSGDSQIICQETPK